MNRNENIYTKAFIEAILYTVVLVIVDLILYPLMKVALPNLFILGSGAFVGFYLVKVLFFKFQQKPKK